VYNPDEVDPVQLAIAQYPDAVESKPLAVVYIPDAVDPVQLAIAQYPDAVE
jgi:DNA-directed RNA polymerase